METNSSPSNSVRGGGDGTGSIASFSGNRSLSSSMHTAQLTSAEAAKLRQHLAETQEQYQAAVVKLRRQTARRKATELELQLLKESSSGDNGEGGSGGGVAILDAKYKQLIEDHAIALEQREAHAEQIHSLKELVHSLNQELKEYRSSGLSPRVGGANSYQSNQRVQDLEEEVSKWEALYYESAEMSVSQLSKVETKLLASQERESKLQEELKEVRQSMLEIKGTNEGKQGILEMQLEMAHEAEQVALSQATSEANQVKRLKERVAQEESKNTILECQLKQHKMESEEQISNFVVQHRENEATLQEQVEHLETQLKAARTMSEGQTTALKSTAAAVTTTDDSEKISQFESRIVELEGLLKDVNMESEERISKLTENQKGPETALQKQLEDAQERIYHLEEKERTISKTEQDNALRQTEDQSQTQEIQTLKEQLSKLQSKLDSTMEENKRLRSVKDSLSGFDKEINKVIESLETELPIAKAEHDALKTQLEDEIEKSKSAAEEFQLREDVLLEQLAEQTSLAEETQTQLEELQGQQHKVDFLRQSMIDLKEDLEDAQDTIWELQEENEQLLRERKSWWKQNSGSSPGKRPFQGSSGYYIGNIHY